MNKKIMFVLSKKKKRKKPGPTRFAKLYQDQSAKPGEEVKISRRVFHGGRETRVQSFSMVIEIQIHASIREED